MKYIIFILTIFFISCTNEIKNEISENIEVEGACQVTYNSKEITWGKDTMRDRNISLERIIDSIRMSKSMSIIFGIFDSNFTTLLLNNDVIFKDTLNTNWSTATAGNITIKLDKTRQNNLIIEVEKCNCNSIVPNEYLQAQISYFNDTIWISYDNQYHIYY